MLDVPSLRRSLSDVVEEYAAKAAALDDALAAFNRAGDDLKTAATVGGTWGNVTLNVGHLYDREMKMSLLRSAWRHVYDGLNIAQLSSATDRRRWESVLESPPPFTIEEIRKLFGDYVLNPRQNMLRALAEAFCALDRFYKSHDRVKVGVKGLPKRVIIRGFQRFGGGWGEDRLKDVLNALAVYEGLPLLTYREICALRSDERALEKDGDLPVNKTWSEPARTVGRDVRLRMFDNGNGHLFFGPRALRSINKALAEFYGDVLPDGYDPKPNAPAPSTAVAKDLQFYATPAAVADDLVAHLALTGKRCLDPSCGEGAIMEAVRRAGGIASGIEVHPGRAFVARSKGFPVLVANFLEHPAPAEADLFDVVLMNPPFYGKHYAKHVERAMLFLKPGGTLKAVLPASARYDHGLVDGEWHDLPVGAFSSSGTNVCTTVLTVRKPR